MKVSTLCSKRNGNQEVVPNTVTEVKEGFLEERAPETKLERFDQEEGSFYPE
jgi:hypothetical protein